MSTLQPGPAGFETGRDAPAAQRSTMSSPSTRLPLRAGVLAAVSTVRVTAAGTPASAEEPTGPVTSVSAIVLTDDGVEVVTERVPQSEVAETKDRKSTRLNSSHANISYAVFCL